MQEHITWEPRRLSRLALAEGLRSLRSSAKSPAFTALGLWPWKI